MTLSLGLKYFTGAGLPFSHDIYVNAGGITRINNSFVVRGIEISDLFHRSTVSLLAHCPSALLAELLTVAAIRPPQNAPCGPPDGKIVK